MNTGGNAQEGTGDETVGALGDIGTADVGDGNPLEELARATMVIIQKGKGYFWSIGIVEVTWKVCTAVANCRLKWGVVLHKDLHRFRVGHGTGTATLEANLAQQVAGIAHKPLFQVFLDIHKAYDSLDRV